MTHPGEIRQNRRLYQAAGRIQDDDHSLLMGGTGLFAVPVTVMFITGKADWYNLEPG
jgi:inner membrane protein involved in colicin E2 resistance